MKIIASSRGEKKTGLCPLRISRKGEAWLRQLEEFRRAVATTKVKEFPWILRMSKRSRDSGAELGDTASQPASQLLPTTDNWGESINIQFDKWKLGRTHPVRESSKRHYHPRYSEIVCKVHVKAIRRGMWNTEKCLEEHTVVGIWYCWGVVVVVNP